MSSGRYGLFEFYTVRENSKTQRLQCRCKLCTPMSYVSVSNINVIESPFNTDLLSVKMRRMD